MLKFFFFHRWMLRKRTDHSEAIKNMLLFFDLIGVLSSNKLSQEVVNVLGRTCGQLLARRTGLVPPSECTITTHELLHLVDQSTMIGCPRFSNLFKFEKVNKFLKEMLKNCAKGFASIMKNYMLKEAIFLETAIDVAHIQSINNLQKFLPRDVKGMKNLSSYVNRIHVDNSDLPDGNVLTEMFDIENCNVMHLRGEKHSDKFSTSLFSYLLCNALEYPDVTAPDDSLLKRVYDEWNGGSGSKRYESFLHFLKKSFDKYNPMGPQSAYIRYLNIIRQIKDKELQQIFQDDFNFLVDCFSTNDVTQVYPEDYMFFT